MHQQKDLFVRIWPFFVIYFIYNFAAIAMTQYFGRDELHLFFNKYHDRFFDKFFVIYTDFGTYYLFFILLGYLFWKETKRRFLYLLISGAVATTISVFFKNTYFHQVLRPGYYFTQKNIDINLVKNYAVQMESTFPSGHSLTATIIAMMLCLLTTNRWLQVFFGLLFPSIARINDRIFYIYLYVLHHQFIQNFKIGSKKKKKWNIKINFEFHLFNTM